MLEYRAYSDSLISYGSIDSTLTHGILLPASWLVAAATESKMVFGNDSVRCLLHYTTVHIYKSQNESSLLSGIINIITTKKDDKIPVPEPPSSSITTYKKVVAGTLLHPAYRDTVRFYFDRLTIRKNLDSADVTGYLKAGTDSLFVRALYNAIPLHGKNVKPMQILQGYSLVSAEGVLYGFLQHAPLIKSNNDVLYINPKTPPTLQMLAAAYFSLVSGLMHSNTNEHVF